MMSTETALSIALTIFIEKNFPALLAFDIEDENDSGIPKYPRRPPRLALPQQSHQTSTQPDLRNRLIEKLCNI
jgi:hypothetical protein